MTQHVVLFQATNGFLVGFVGAHPSEVLNQIEEDFGIGAADEVGVAIAQMADRLSKAVDPRGSAPSPAGQPAGGVAPSEPAAADSTSAVEAPGQQQLGGTGSDPEPAQASEQAGEAAGSPRCGICGGGVKPDRAEVSLEEYGEVRCRGCSA